LAYAFVWADNIRENTVRFNLKYNPHTPMKMRVNGQMPQLDFWYNAFNITDKDSMYIEKEKRVEIW
jgi:putative endopeptidase